MSRKSESDTTEPVPAQAQPSEVFIRALSDHQPQLRGFIAASLGDPSSVPDVLQKTNLTLWKKATQFKDDEPFLPWAIAFARYEVLGHWRDRKRSRLAFDTDVVELMCSVSERVVDEVPDRLEALGKCLDKVPRERRALLDMRYVGNLSLQDISTRTGKSIDSVKSVLKRLRRALADCVLAELAADRL